MFESGYTFELLTVGHPTTEFPLIKKLVYCFKTRRNRRYLVHIHEYDYKCFVVKFHDVRHKNLPNRFNLVLNDFDCSKILTTVINIAQVILEKESFASFAFVGVTVDGKEKEDKPISQRFRIYKYIAENLLGSQTFLHGFEEKSNCYLLVNRKHPDPEETYRHIVEMFTKEYEEIGTI
jgi:hypothetical protein